MKSSFKNEKVVPIIRGEEIRLKNFQERVKELQNRAMSSYSVLVELERQKRTLLEQELKEPVDEQNIELISLFNQDLAKIEENLEALDDILIRAFNKLEEIREMMNEISASYIKESGE